MLDRFFYAYERAVSRLTLFDKDKYFEKTDSLEKKQALYIKEKIEILRIQLEKLVKLLPNVSKNLISTSENPSRDAKEILKNLSQMTFGFRRTIDKFNAYCGDRNADPCFLEKQIAEIRSFAKFAEDVLNNFKQITIELDQTQRRLFGFDFETLNEKLKPIVDIASSVSMYMYEPEEQYSNSGSR